MLSATECGRGSGRKELVDERVGGQRETWRKFVKGGEGKASEEQEPQFQIHNLKDPAIYSRPGPLQESSLTPCHPALALSLLASDVGPALCHRRASW